MDKTQKYYEGRKKNRAQEVCPLIPFMWNSRNGKATYCGRKKISGFLVWCEGAGADFKRVQMHFGKYGNIQYLDFRGIYTVYLSYFIKVMFNYVALLFVNHTSIN